MMKNNVPVVLFVFNRPKQLRKTLAHLKQNKISLLIVYCDGPRDEGDEKHVMMVIDLIKGITWTKVELHRRSKNLGLSESIQQGLGEVFIKHETAIVIEDDIAVAPGFYDYMCRALDVYKDREDIAGITGLQYPIRSAALKHSDGDVYLAPRFSSWGWATWRRVWAMTDYHKFGLNHKVHTHKPNLSRGGRDIEFAYHEYIAGRLDGCWDVVFAVNMALKNQYFVWPKVNLITNNGLVEGTHADGSSAWGLNAEGRGNQLVNLPRDLQPDNRIIRDFNRYFRSVKLPLKPRLRRALRNYITQIKEKQSEVRKKPDPRKYTTTDGPQEVLSQKECYYFALNKYVRDGDSVLDVGMGIGYGMGVLSIKAAEVRAVDVDEKAVKYNSQRLLGKNPRVKELILYAGKKLPFKDKTFDVVTCIDVIEHVEDYQAFLDELLRVAKRSVIVATPNRRAEYTNPDGTPTNYWHLREWSYEEFDKIAHNQSSATVDWHFVNGPWEGPHTITKKLQVDTLALLPVFNLREK